ncbi:hypothetical protein DNU06_10470 [Putridiphycobacter roseus]|uniref:PKD domain-containing protein n=1 Tax=Putridiphycobacter roseus TaxID=2219161 RepID=A0A2W1MZ35_9FLAO|nr:choice-of-anchor I family protein [Putridiphycobacter roseus]PZE17157.1 hypothetical protein DNU06_10470 [Putridiphycobacter roseus]
MKKILLSLIGIGGIVFQGSAQLDVTAPVVTAVNPITSIEILVVFSEDVTLATASDVLNYTGLGTVNTAVFSGMQMDSVTLTLASGLDLGVTNTITVSNVADNSSNNNVMVNSNHSFIFNNSTPNIIITEIMYNSPESGTDSLEFIEIYNNGTSDAYLGGFEFTNGVNYIFPTDTLSPAAFYLIAVDQAVAEVFFGMAFNGEFTGALSNGGELLKIVNTFGITIDSVDYDDASPWPTGPIDPDGDGASIELIDINQPNEMASNWTAGSIQYGIVNGSTVFASPGAFTPQANMPLVNVVNSNLTFDETAGLVSIGLDLTNSNGMPSIVKVKVSTGSTADVNDFSVPLSLTFPGNVDTTMNFDINIVDDMLTERTEYISLIFLDSSNTEIGSTNIATVYIKDDEFTAPIGNGSINMEPIYTYTVPTGSAEISAYDPSSKKLFVGNTTSNLIEVLDISDPHNGALLQTIAIGTYGNLNSIAVWGDTIALAMENSTDPQLAGSVVFLDASGALLNQLTAGAMPDMVTFTPDHSKVLSANEGEPDDNYTNDPEGSISVIDISNGVLNASITNATFTSFNAQQVALEASGVNIYGPGSTVAQDLEPEYITVNETSTIAWITLQENNALAKLDLATNTITDIYPLGYKDHSLPGNAMDVSNDNSEVLIANWPTKGMYQPDAIASFSVGTSTYLVTANEGDSRDYNGLEEEERIGDGSYPLDSTIFGDFMPILKDDLNGGRLKTTNTIGDIDNDGDFDEIYSFGARSFSIWDENGVLVYDSGDDFEQITAADATFSSIFNTSNSNVSFKNRSDDKGPEPEGIVTGVINDTVYAFITLERVGGIMVYDVSDVTNPLFVQYINNRDVATATGDLGPEGIIFVNDNNSPIDTALVIVSNEVSGTVTIYKINHTIILPPLADFNEDDHTICEGTTVNYTNESIGVQDTWEWTFNGGTPATSTLENPTVTYTIAGQYDVQLIVSNVNGTDTLMSTNHMEVFANPIAPTISQIDALTLSSTEVNGNQWNDVNGEVTGAINQTFVPGVDGDYSVTYTDVNGCSATSSMFSFSDYSSVDDYDGKTLIIYPNPAAEVLNFNKILNVEVIDLSGKIVLAANQVNAIDISDLSPGMYALKTSNGKQLKFIKK